MTKYSMRSLYLSKEIKLNDVRKTLDYKLASFEREMLVYEIAPDKYVFIYSFGSVVFYNTGTSMADKIIQLLTAEIVKPVPKYLYENYIVMEDASAEADIVDFNKVVLNKTNLMKISIISRILAQSVAIEYFESMVDDMILIFEGINKSLETEGRFNTTDKEIKKFIGASNSIIFDILSKLSLLDKPDVTWESARLEHFFYKLRSMFELESRFKDIVFKIGFIQNNTDMLLGILQHKRETILELAIIVLILIEIFIYICEYLIR